jgi:predicted RNase H-like nuclease (RuvC/YqgF family)
MGGGNTKLALDGMSKEIENLQRKLAEKENDIEELRQEIDEKKKKDSASHTTPQGEQIPAARKFHRPSVHARLNGGESTPAPRNERASIRSSMMLLEGGQQQVKRSPNFCPSIPS